MVISGLVKLGRAVDLVLTLPGTFLPLSKFWIYPSNGPAYPGAGVRQKHNAGEPFRRPYWNWQKGVLSGLADALVLDTVCFRICFCARYQEFGNFWFHMFDPTRDLYASAGDAQSEILRLGIASVSRNLCPVYPCLHCRQDAILVRQYSAFYSCLIIDLRLYYYPWCPCGCENSHDDKFVISFRRSFNARLISNLICNHEPLVEMWNRLYVDGLRFSEHWSPLRCRWSCLTVDFSIVLHLSTGQQLIWSHGSLPWTQDILQLISTHIESCLRLVNARTVQGVPTRFLQVPSKETE